jgi:DNA-binding SARP family transcriptional activator
MAMGLTQSDGAFASEAFDRHPYAMLVLDGAGRVVARNGAALRLLGRRRLDIGRGRVGCELMGCRSADGPLAGVCVHERALQHDGPLPEIRIDLPDGAGADAAWVTVARLGTEPDHVLMELRPGARHDRRRRTEPHWTSGPQLRIHALGRTRVLSDEGPIEGRWLSNRAGQILKFLVCERHRVVFADEIVEKLSPSAGLPGTRGLRYFIHVLRDELEPGRAQRQTSAFVLATRGGYALDPVHVWVDATELEEHVRAGLTAYRRGEAAEAAARLTRGLELYDGDFLADEPYAEWAVRERDRLREIASDGLRTLADLKERDGDLVGATGCLERLTDLEPFDVDVHRDLLALLVRRGRRSMAMRRYNALRRQMLLTFDEELPFALADLLVEDGQPKTQSVQPMILPDPAGETARKPAP